MSTASKSLLGSGLTRLLHLLPDYSKLRKQNAGMMPFYDAARTWHSPPERPKWSQKLCFMLELGDLLRVRSKSGTAIMWSSRSGGGTSRVVVCDVRLGSCEASGFKTSSCNNVKKGIL